MKTNVLKMLELVKKLSQILVSIALGEYGTHRGLPYIQFVQINDF